MKQMKYLIGLFVVIGTLISSFALASTTFEDTFGTYYDEAVTLMTELGIMKGESNGLFMPEKTVSRNEFIDCLYEVFDENKVDLESIEDEITNRTVTYFDVIKACIDGLGYKSIMYVDYPNRYFAKCLELGLTDGIEEPLEIMKELQKPFVGFTFDFDKAEEQITKGNLAIILWNTLNSGMWDVSDSEKDKTLLEKTFDNQYFIGSHDYYTFEGFQTEGNKVYLVLDDSEAETKLKKKKLLYERTDFYKLLQEEKLDSVVIDLRNNKIVYLQMDMKKFDEGTMEDVEKLSDIPETDFDYIYYSRKGKSIKNYTALKVESEFISYDKKERMNAKSLDSNVIIKNNSFIKVSDLEVGDVLSKVVVNDDTKNCFYIVSPNNGEVESVTDVYMNVYMTNQALAFKTNLDGKDIYHEVASNAELFLKTGEIVNATEYFGALSPEQLAKFCDKRCRFYVDFCNKVVAIEFETFELVEEEEAFWSKTSSWAEEELLKAKEAKLIPEIFRNQDLTNAITRKEFAHVAVKLWEKLSGKSATSSQTNPFTDTNDLEVIKAYNLGITNGTSDTTFSPDSLITREQMATMMTRAIEKAGYNVSVDLTTTEKFLDDGEMHEWGRNAIYYMSHLGIIKGIGNGQYGVTGNATREQAVIISYRTKSCENI